MAAINRLQKGFSLIELMVAMVIGLMLLGGIVSVFSSSRKSFDLTQNISLIQENARYAIETISSSIRIAGFQGCAVDDIASVNVSAQNPPTTNLFLDAISGAEISGTAWQPARPVILQNLTPQPLSGSDVLLLQFGSPTTSRLQFSMPSVQSAIQLVDNSTGLSDGDFAIISDCDSADLFRVSSISKSNAVTHTAPFNNSNNLAKAYTVSATSVQDVTRIMKYNYIAYYVADTGRVNTSGDPIYSLYMYDIDDIQQGTGGTELIEGVENLQLLYGVRDNNNVRYVRADDTNFLPASVTSVQIGMLMASVESTNDEVDNRTYTLLDSIIGPADGTTTAAGYPVDKRNRMVFTTTAKIRNRRL